VPNAHLFDPESLVGASWLADLYDIPADAAWPRYMTPPHPDAVGSYGTELEEWLLAEQGVTLRWWQRLATRRQLEHDAAGELVWETVIDSESRRSGKSTRLRGLATWRMARQALFGEVQTVIHTGSDMAICREIQRGVWRWAEEVAGWSVTRANGKEAVESLTGDRWLVRSQSAVYGYDCSLGLVDEGWNVPPAVVDEGLEPALLERRMPQLVLTSTAHRRATSLMRRKIAAGLAGMGEDFATLLMLWGAGGGDDIGDPAVWRAASPHWSAHRLKLIRGKYERAMRGEADPDADDLDPAEGFKAQYLNVWPEPSVARPAPGEPVFTAAEWAGLDGYRPGQPRVAAVEAWFSQGAALSMAEPLPDGRVGVSSVAFADVPSAVGAARAAGIGVILVGKSLAAGELGVEGVGGTTRQAVLDLRRFADDGVLAHDGSAVLAEQALGLRVAASSDGPRLVSKGRADAVKSAVWAVARARESGAPQIW
jgi:hypothetical protein